MKAPEKRARDHHLTGTTQHTRAGVPRDDRENLARGSTGSGCSCLRRVCAADWDRGLPACARQPRAWLLWQAGGDRAEFVTLSFWESRAAIEGFVGQDIEKAVFYPDDEQFLIERDLTVQHYQVAGTG